jgi:hypothetical protein
MNLQLLFLCGLTAAIHFVSTLSYGIRIAGIRTGRLALSLALFNVMVLLSRSSNSIMAPLLSKRIESRLHADAFGTTFDFRMLLVAATLATICAAIFIPSFQRFAVISVGAYERKKSVVRLLFTALSSTFWRALRKSMTIPKRSNFKGMFSFSELPPSIYLMNIVGTGLISTGVFSALYAGILAPELRLTAGNLSAAVNMLGTLILFGVVDPHFSFMSDRVVAGEESDARFRRAVTSMTASRIFGTILGQAILVPGAILIVWIAYRI